MTKRRRTHDNGDHNLRSHHQQDDEFIPLPIQTFLWRQTSPFVRPYLGKARDLAQIEQRDASALLSNKLIKDYNFNRLGGNEAKMMYTLQWILMNASEECADSENEAKTSATNAAMAAASAASLLKPSGYQTSGAGASGQGSEDASGGSGMSGLATSASQQQLNQQQQQQQLEQMHKNRVGSTSSTQQSILLPAAAAAVAVASPAGVSSIRMQAQNSAQQQQNATGMPSSSSSVSPIGPSTPTKPATSTAFGVGGAGVAATGAGAGQSAIGSQSDYLLPISSIQMFVYYFAPIMDNLKHSDFLTSNQRLEIGTVLWEPLFEHCLPDIHCLRAQIKPSKSSGLTEQLSSNPADTTVESATTTTMPTASGKFAKQRPGSTRQHTIHAAGSPTKKILPTEAARRRSSALDQTQFGDVFLGEPTPSPPTTSGGAGESQKRGTDEQAADDATQQAQSTTTATAATGPQPSTSSSGSASKAQPSRYINSTSYATYLDVAVLRCLFISDWQESGVYWSLTYLSNRLAQTQYSMAADTSARMRPKSRSLSCLDARDLLYHFDSEATPTATATDRQPRSRSAGKQSGSQVAQQTASATSKGRRGRRRESSGDQRGSKADIAGASYDSAASQQSSARFLRVEDAADASDAGSDAAAAPRSPARKLSFSGLQTFAQQIRKTSKRVKKGSSDASSTHTSQQQVNAGSQSSIAQSGSVESSGLPLMSIRRSSSADDLTVGQVSALSLLHDSASFDQQYAADRAAQMAAMMGSSQPSITVVPSGSGNRRHHHLYNQYRKHQSTDQIVHTQSLNCDNELEPNRAGDESVQSRRRGSITAEQLEQYRNCLMLSKRQQYLSMSFLGKNLEKLTRRQTIPKNMHFAPYETLKDVASQNESTSAMHYVDELGRIDPIVVLKLLHSVSQRELVCSQRVCDRILSLLTKLISLGVLKTSHQFCRKSDQQRDLLNLLSTAAGRATLKQPPNQSSYTFLDGTSHALNMSIDRQLNEQQQLEEALTRTALLHKILIDIVIRLHQHLGCPNSCSGLNSDSSNGNDLHTTTTQLLPTRFGSSLRARLRNLLEHLSTYNRENFIRYIQDIVVGRPLRHVIDMLHSILGFCRPEAQQLQQQSQVPQAIQKPPQVSNIGRASHPSATSASSSGAHHTVQFVTPQTSSSSITCANQAAQHCGEQASDQKLGSKSTSASGSESVESLVISNSFKHLVARVAAQSKELKFQENTALYCDIRKLISFTRHNYSSTFRSIVLSALIDSTKLLHRQQKLIATAERKRTEEANRLQRRADDFNASTAPPSTAHMQSDDEFVVGSQHATSSLPATSHFKRRKGLQESQPATVESGARTHSALHQKQRSLQGSPTTLGPSAGKSAECTADHSQADAGDASGDSLAKERTSLGSNRFYPSPPRPFQTSPLQNLSAMQQQDQRQNAGLLSLSKAKKKLERVFGAKASAQSPNATGPIKVGRLPPLDSDLNQSGSLNGGVGNQVDAHLLDDASLRRASMGQQSLGSLHDSVVTRQQQQQQQHFIQQQQLYNAQSATYLVQPTGTHLLRPSTSAYFSGAEMAKQNELLYATVRLGMSNFSFLMESCLPGDFLDPALLAALLDLKSPIAVRAGIFLECANFVHRCNRGQWPAWMRLNVQHQHKLHRRHRQHHQSVSSGSRPTVQSSASTGAPVSSQPLSSTLSSSSQQQQQLQQQAASGQQQQSQATQLQQSGQQQPPQTQSVQTNYPTHNIVTAIAGGVSAAAAATASSSSTDSRTQSHQYHHRSSTVGLQPTASSTSKSRKSSSVQRTARNNTLMYRAAGRAFYAWAEAVGTRLEELLQSEQDDYEDEADDSVDDEDAEDELGAGEINRPAEESAGAGDDSETDTEPVQRHRRRRRRRRSRRAAKISQQQQQNQQVSPESCDFFQPTINGSSSPFALKMAACQLLFEVTTFLRETYRYLPPTMAAQTQALGSKGSDKLGSIYDVSRAVTANRRWSMALSSLGFGQLPATLSAISAGGGAQAAVPAPSASKSHLRNPATASIPEHPERRISFILHETKDENDQSSASDQQVGDSSSQQQQQQAADDLARGKLPTGSSLISAVAQHRPIMPTPQTGASNAVVMAAATCLLRSSGMIDGSAHRRKSIKLKKPAQEKEQQRQDKRTKFAQDYVDEELENSSISDIGGTGTMVRRADSLKSRRRVSGISEKSDTSERGIIGSTESSNNLAGAPEAASSGGAAQIQASSSGAAQASNENLSGNESGNESCDEFGVGSGANLQSELTGADKLEDENSIMSNMPWFKAISLFNNSIDCTCVHFPTCRPRCYKTQQAMCKKLLLYVQSIYQDPNNQRGYATSVLENRLQDFMKQAASSSKREQQQRQQQAGDLSAGDQTSSGKRNRRDKRSRKQQQHYSDYQSDSNMSSLAHSPRFKPGKHTASSATDPIGGFAVFTTTGDSSSTMMSSMMTDTVRALNAAKAKDRTVEEAPLIKYMKFSVKSLLHCPMSSFLKGAIILARENFLEMIGFAWNLLLEDDQQLSRTAAVCFIISSIKCPNEASKLLLEELESSDASRKIAAINKFYVIWDARYQCWPRLEDGAFVHFKMAPPSIEFTLPSPKIAQESRPVVDPPWMPRKTSNVEEVTIGQDQTVQKSFVTATKTRRKQQIELVTKALREKHDKLREDREKYHITSVPITLYAAYEPTLSQQPGTGDDMDGSAGAGAAGGTGSSGAGGSGTGEDDAQENRALLQMKTAQALFPTCLCQAAIVMINLLDDPRVTYEGSAVYEVASRVIWSCLVEDPALFLRYFFERLTRQNQNTIFQVLRRLIRFMPRLPPQAAYTLYNYLIGFIIYYIRCPSENSQKLIADTLSVLCLVVPSVYGLFLKDLKQILRKEQCDHNLLVTANVPSAKKIIVHGSDSSGIPSQFPIDETTQFYHILVDSLEFFGVDKHKQNEYFLIDVRTNLMHNIHAYVRDYYSFKRSQHPQLQLINMDSAKAFDILQKQELINQFLEFGKVSMSLSIVKSSHMAVQRVLFLHEELMKLPTFPRKALETNFNLFRGSLGHQVLSMDRIHKICWVRVIARMFELTSGFFLQLGDIQLFLNAISGIFVLHCEEASVSRLCLATFINAAHQFKSIFATDGFLSMMATIVQVYSNHQTNLLLCRSIEFVCKQFYIMHRKPFLLQLFGSVAPRLNTSEILQHNQSSFPIGLNQPSGANAAGNLILNDPSRISPAAFFRLIQSLEKAFKDPLDILELVDAEKPLRAVDFCYQQDKEAAEILDIISLCVTVTAYASESPRSTQMLIILESVVPFYMKHLQGSTSKKAGQSMGKQAHKDELQKIQSISICIRTLIVNCEGLTRNFSGPLPSIDFRSSSIRRTGPTGSKSAHSKNANQNNSAGSPMDIYNDEHSFTGPPERSRDKRGDGSGATNRQGNTGAGGAANSGAGGQGGGGATSGAVGRLGGRSVFNSDESEITRAEFILPRDTLLNLVAEFLSLSTGRLVESAKKYVDLHQKHSSYELLDVKSHLRLAEVANSLLKFASTDPSVMACRGLIRYMNEILPNTEWRQEAIRPALIMILKRLDKTFNRIAKKNWVKRNIDWEAAKQLLKGAYLTFIKHPYIVHLPHLKSLISCCQNIILSDGIQPQLSLQTQPSPAANLFHGFGSQQQQQVNGIPTSVSQQQQQQQPSPAATSSQFKSLASHYLNVGTAAGGSVAGGQVSPSGSMGGGQVSGLASPSTGAPQVSVQSQPGTSAAPSLAAITTAATLVERLAANNLAANNAMFSQGFNSVTIRLIAMQLLQTGDSQTLESFIGNSMSTPEKLESLMLNLIYPMCIRVCSGAREAPKMRVCDIMFVLNTVLGLLAPQSASSKSCSSTSNSPKAATDTSQFILSKITTTIGSTQTGATALGIVSGSTAHSAASSHAIVQHQEGLKIGFLGLKILCVCFEAQLANEWVRIARVIRDLVLQPGQPSGPLWDFLDFVATYRFPVYILLLPTIKCHLAAKVRAECARDNKNAHLLQCQRMIEAKLYGPAPTVCRSKSFLFVSLTAELRMFNEQLVSKRRALIEGERQVPSHGAGSTAQSAQQASAGSNATGGGGSSVSGATGSGPTGAPGKQGAAGQSSVGSLNPAAAGQTGGDGSQATQGEHVTAYHRLSAAIASFATQTTQSGRQGTSAGSSTSAALKGACLAAQLGTSAPIGQQMLESGSGNRSPAADSVTRIDLQQQQQQQQQPAHSSSIRLSTAKSREEARKVMNNILRRTSYPHNQPLLSTTTPSTSSTGAAEGAATSGSRATSSRHGSGSAEAATTASGGDTGSQSVGHRASQIIMDPAMLMAAAFPPRKPKPASGSGESSGGGILKQLVRSIDQQNQSKSRAESLGGGGGESSSSKVSADELGSSRPEESVQKQ